MNKKTQNARKQGGPCTQRRQERSTALPAISPLNEPVASPGREQGTLCVFAPSCCSCPSRASPEFLISVYWLKDPRPKSVTNTQHPSRRMHYHHSDPQKTPSYVRHCFRSFRRVLDANTTVAAWTLFSGPESLEHWFWIWTHLDHSGPLPTWKHYKERNRVI